MFLRAALLLSTAHGFTVTAGPRCSASVSTRRSLVVAAMEVDKTVEGEYPHPSDSDYKFGDFTKGAIKGFEGVVQSATGNDEYKFGDVTKNFAKNLFGGLEKGAAAAKKKIDDAEEK